MNETPMPEAAPLSIRVDLATRMLEMVWADDTHALLAHRELRCACKCADCERERRTGVPKVNDVDVSITDVTVVGVGAVRFQFSDGHGRGIFPFAYLRQLALKCASDKQIRATGVVVG
jgi:DUF971 family protein